MPECDVLFIKNGVPTIVHPSTKRIIADNICERLKPLNNELAKFPNGHIRAQYENEKLLLYISGYPKWLARKMEKAIRDSGPEEQHFH